MRRTVLALLTTSVLLTTACATPEPTVTVSPSRPPTTSPKPQEDSALPDVDTTNLLGSLRPDTGSDADPENIRKIRERGRLMVGIDQSQNLLSFRNTATGELQGFEVDLAREISRDIFGDPTKIDFRYIDADTWVKALENNDVDLAIRSISITRGRQDQVFFSTPYFSGKTKLFVHKNSGISSVDDLPGKTVCATAESTGAQRTRYVAPRAKLLIVSSSADCLLALQQGHTDAVISDDTILSGMLAQDPFTEIVGNALAEEHYGIAFAKPGPRHDSEGIIRHVNATIERIFRGGTWQRSYAKWFGDYLPSQNPPALNYREEQR
ncbi:ABC transporter glutamine-binding protein glnH [Corynebacterium pseudotuberculosis 267]|nr:ABC transporter glutamine-binding protein glnH [Corynebacterium pseudotuberculosis 267]